MDEKQKPDWRALIRAAMKGSRLKQAQLARRAGLDPRSIRLYQKEGREPTVASLIRIILAVSESEQPALMRQLPPEIWQFAEHAAKLAAKQRGLDISDILFEALRSGLASPSRDSSPDLKSMAENLSKVAKEKRQREHPTDAPGKDRHSKTA